MRISPQVKMMRQKNTTGTENFLQMTSDSGNTISD